MINKLFLDHPKSVCLTYIDHFKLSSNIGIKLGVASIKAFIHAILPFCFIKSSSNIVEEIDYLLKINKCN